MAKREKKQRPVIVTRKYQSRVAQEQRQLRYIRIGALALLTLVVLVLLAGLFKTQIADPAATRSAKEALKSVPAVTVNGDVISVAEWQSRVRYARWQSINQIFQIDQQLSLFDPATEFGQQLITQGQAQIEEIRNVLELGDGIAAEVLDEMVEERLVRQEAARQGITVTPEELQKYIEVDLFRYPFPPTPEPVPTLPPPTVAPTVTVTPAPTLTPTLPPTPRSQEDFEANYEGYTQELQQVADMSEEMWRSMIESELYRQKLLETFDQELETNVLHVKGRYISTPDQETADEFLARLEAGESFDTLAEEVDADESEEPVATTGSFDWQPLSVLDESFGPEFSKIVENAEAGSYASEALLGINSRYYVLYVEGKEERELADYLQEQQRQEEFDVWLGEQKAGEGLVYGNWRDYIPRDPSL